jgi:hypothetical protein
MAYELGSNDSLNFQKRTSCLSIRNLMLMKRISIPKNLNSEPMRSLTHGHDLSAKVLNFLNLIRPIPRCGQNSIAAYRWNFSLESITFWSDLRVNPRAQDIQVTLRCQSSHKWHHGAALVI